jgi:hypothetical protein
MNWEGMVRAQLEIKSRQINLLEVTQHDHIAG